MHLDLVAQTVAWCSRDMTEVSTIVVSGLGLCTALGPDPVPALQAGQSAVHPHPDLVELPHQTAAFVEQIDVRPWLMRRKDIKLMARPSRLALAAAGPALASWEQDRDAVGLFLGVGREPSDDGESEPALVAAQQDGRLDAESVAGRCRDLYPPLLPLKTLPNMALAHISIHLGIRGENGTWCGGAAAGLTALRSAIWSLREGRVPAALVVAADTWVSAGGVRDLLRMSSNQVITPPGEAGVALFLETAESAKQRGAPVYAVLDLAPPVTTLATPTHHEQLGDCKAADALLALVLRIGGGPGEATITAVEPGQPALGVRVSVESDFACYPVARVEQSHG